MDGDQTLQKRTAEVTRNPTGTGNNMSLLQKLAFFGRIGKFVLNKWIQNPSLTKRRLQTSVSRHIPLGICGGAGGGKHFVIIPETFPSTLPSGLLIHDDPI
jgi:hypothetical protein